MKITANDINKDSTNMDTLTDIISELKWGDLDPVKAHDRVLALFGVSDALPHYFSPSKDDTKFCICGKYLTDDCHKRQL